jgi:hypothetical protein
MEGMGEGNHRRATWQRMNAGKILEWGNERENEKY